VVPIYFGLVLKHALFCDNFGGNHSSQIILDYLKDPKLKDYNGELLNWKNKKYDQREIVENIKAKLSFASLNFEDDIKKEKVFDIEETCFELPDKTIIKLNNEVKFKSAEVLLRPSLLIEGKIE